MNQEYLKRGVQSFYLRTVKAKGLTPWPGRTIPRHHIKCVTVWSVVDYFRKGITFIYLFIRSLLVPIMPCAQGPVIFKAIGDNKNMCQ